jgi:hypothetical protein
VFWIAKPCGLVCACEHVERFNVIVFRLEVDVNLPDYTVSSQTPRTYQIRVSSPSVCTYQAAYCRHNPCAHVRLHTVISFRVHISGCILSTFSIFIYQAAYCQHIPFAHIRLHAVITFHVRVSSCILSSHSVCTYQAAHCHHIPCPNVIAPYSTHEEQKS